MLLIDQLKEDVYETFFNHRFKPDHGDFADSASFRYKFPQIAEPVEFEEDFDESSVPISKKGIPKTRKRPVNQNKNS